jgi:hypothetical protein
LSDEDNGILPTDDKKPVHFTAKIIHGDGTEERRSGSGTSEDFTKFFMSTVTEAQAKDTARCARWLVDEKGQDIRGLSGFLMNIHRRIRGFPKGVREYVKDYIAIELDANDEYHVMVARGRYQWSRVVLSFEREGMEILHYEPEEAGEMWEAKIKEWIK